MIFEGGGDSHVSFQSDVRFRHERPRSCGAGLSSARCVLATSAAEAQMPQSYVVTIDASTTQPVGTGFIPPDSNGEVIVFAGGSASRPEQPGSVR